MTSDSQPHTRKPDQDGRVRQIRTLAVNGPDHIGRITLVSHERGAVVEMVRHNGVITAAQAAADAAEMCRRWNAHDALLDALREIVSVFWDDHEDCRYCDAPEGTPHDPDALCAQALAAIAVAEGDAS